MSFNHKPLTQQWLRRPVGIACGLALLWMATGTAVAADKPVMGGTAVIAIGEDPPTVNPDLSTGSPDQLIGCMIYQGLTQVTTALQVKPLLAKSWTISPDGKTYEFQLQQAKWHDGKPFTSDDVKYSIIDISGKFSSIFASAARMIERVDAPTPDKVVIKLKEPFGPLLLSLTCGGGGAIVPAHLYRNTDVLRNPATTTKPVGTGPFKLVEWNRGTSIKLTKNKDYWESGKPYLDEIVAQVMPNASSMLAALQAGEVDFVPGYYVASNDQRQISGNKRLQLRTSGFPGSTTLLFMNVRRKPLDDVKVRQALFTATDRNYLLKNAWFGSGKPGVSGFNSGIDWALNPNVNYDRQYAFDTAKANQMLDAAGYKKGANGMRFTLHIAYASNAGDRGQVAVALKSMWRAAGVDVVIDSIERSAQLKRVHQDAAFDTSIESYSTYGDPAFGVARIYASNSIGKVFGNLSGYSNPEVDALLQEGERTTATKDRAIPYRKVQEIIARDMPTMNLRDSRTMDAATAKLSGTSVWDYLGPSIWTEAWLAK